MKKSCVSIFLIIFLLLTLVTHASSTPPIPIYHLIPGQMFKTKERVFIINAFVVLNNIAELKEFLLTAPAKAQLVWSLSTSDLPTQLELDELQAFCDEHKIYFTHPRAR